MNRYTTTKAADPDRLPQDDGSAFAGYDLCRPARASVYTRGLLIFLFSNLLALSSQAVTNSCPRAGFEPEDAAEVQPYQDMCCHSFALSGNPNDAAITQLNARYSDYSTYFRGRIEGVDYGIALDPVTAGELDTIANRRPRNRPQAVMEFLRDNFGFSRPTEPGRVTDDSPKLWGLFRDDPGLGVKIWPEHMWITRDGHIYDTFINNPIKRSVNRGGLNPPSEAELLNRNDVYSIPVDQLTPHHEALISEAAGAGQWGQNQPAP